MNKHNVAIKAITEAITIRQDKIAQIDDGYYDRFDKDQVKVLRKIAVEEEIELTGSLMLLRESELE